MQTLTIGSEPDNDLVVAGTDARHARLSLDERGHAWLQACDPDNAVHLGRQRRWRRVRSVCLSVGDQLRLADTPVSLEQLCRPFGAAVILRPAPLNDAAGGNEGEWAGGSSLQRPKRNPRTGMLEETPNL